MNKKISDMSRGYLFIFKEIKKASYAFLWVLIFSILSTGFLPILSQYVLKKITSELETSILANIIINYYNFLYLSSVYVILMLLRTLTLSIREYVNNIASFRLAYNIQSMLIDKIRKIEYKNFYYPKFQDKYKIVLQNCQNKPYIIVFSTALAISSTIQFVSSCVIILRYNLALLVWLVLCFVPSLFANINIKKKYVETMDQTAQSSRKVGYFFNIMTEKDFIKEQRLFNLNSFFSLRRKSSFEENLTFWKKFRKKECTFKFFSAILACSGIFLSLIFLIFDAIKKNISISEFIFYSGIIVSLQEIFDSLTYNVSYSCESMLFIKKLLDFLNLKNEIKFGNKKISNNNIHIIEFKNVSFSYPNSNSFALKNINFKFGTGDIISLAGKNGCGKTTLVNLILRIYNPTKGKILLDGINIKDYDYENYLTFFSSIFQDYQKYAIKLYDYISFGNIKDPKNILIAKQAAISATADTFIKKFPLGFDSDLTTLFDKQGIELSGGQWQKLAITRVFFSKAHMLIFDEPTSALDSISESEIYKNIVKFGKEKITIFISHRMYSSKMAKRIIFLENGEIVGDGTHEKLMSKNPGYKKLYEEQANKYNFNDTSL